MAKDKGVVIGDSAKVPDKVILPTFNPCPYTPSDHAEMMGYLDEWSVVVGEGIIWGLPLNLRITRRSQRMEAYSSPS